MVDSSSKGRFAHNGVVTVCRGRVRCGLARPGPGGARRRARTSPWTWARSTGWIAYMRMAMIMKFTKIITRILRFANRRASKVDMQHHSTGWIAYMRMATIIKFTTVITRILRFVNRRASNVDMQHHSTGWIAYILMATIIKFTKIITHINGGASV